MVWRRDSKEDWRKREETGFVWFIERNKDKLLRQFIDNKSAKRISKVYGLKKTNVIIYPEDKNKLCVAIKWLRRWNGKYSLFYR